MRTAAFLLVVAVLVNGSGSLPSHGAVSETCFGLTPTVTAGAGAGLVRGTEGDDVVIATDVGQVETFGGKDAICVAGVARIDAGSGDDRVLSTAAPDGAVVVLGSGSDVFEGSSGDDEVWAEHVEDGRSTPGEEFVNADTIRTRGGADVVHTGVWVHANNDLVDLGSGPDLLHFAGNAGDARLTGGRGGDRFATWFPAPMPAATYDFEAGLASFLRPNEVPEVDVFATLEGFENASVSVPAATPLIVRGSTAANRIVVRACGAEVDAGPGPDRLRAGSAGCGQATTLRGGPGGDVLVGGDGPDALLGGSGRDRATGHRGIDRCRAEEEKGCEGD